MLPGTGIPKLALEDQAVAVEGNGFRQRARLMFDIGFKVFLGRRLQYDLVRHFPGKNEIKRRKYRDIKLIDIAFERSSAAGRRKPIIPLRGGRGVMHG